MHLFTFWCLIVMMKQIIYITCFILFGVISIYGYWDHTKVEKQALADQQNLQEQIKEQQKTILSLQQEMKKNQDQSNAIQRESNEFIEAAKRAWLQKIQEQAPPQEPGYTRENNTYIVNNPPPNPPQIIVNNDQPSRPSYPVYESDVVWSVPYYPYYYNRGYDHYRYDRHDYDRHVNGPNNNYINQPRQNYGPPASAWQGGSPGIIRQVGSPPASRSHHQQQIVEPQRRIASGRILK